jgi:glycosyltransferase involved in cell wall biosynthesis
MHICHVTSMHDWNDDRIYERACRMLAKLGCRVTLVATREHPGREHGVEVIALTPRSGVARRWDSSREATEKARMVGADIVHFHDPDLLPWMVRLAAGGQRVVYDVHENYVARFGMWGLPAPLARAAGAAFRRYERRCVARFAGVVAVSDSVLDLFQCAARQGCVVQNVPDMDRFSGTLAEGSGEGPPVIYTSGTHSDDRNCVPTIEAMPLVLARHPEARFQFVGRYEPAGYRERLWQRACELGVETSLELDGMLPWEENFQRTARAHIGCVLYADNPNNRVTIPNRLFEYMLCGLGVVAHDFPELRSIVEEARCGHVVDSADPRALATAMIALLDDPEERVRMGGRGRQAVRERYNFRSQCEGMVDFYRSIHGERA